MHVIPSSNDPEEIHVGYGKLHGKKEEMLVSCIQMKPPFVFSCLCFHMPHTSSILGAYKFCPVCLSVTPLVRYFVRLSICPQKNFNIGHHFEMVRDKAFICVFHKCISRDPFFDTKVNVISQGQGARCLASLLHKYTLFVYDLA